MPSRQGQNHPLPKSQPLKIYSKNPNRNIIKISRHPPHPPKHLCRLYLCISFKDIKLFERSPLWRKYPFSQSPAASASAAKAAAAAARRSCSAWRLAAAARAWATRSCRSWERFVWKNREILLGNDLQVLGLEILWISLVRSRIYIQ